MEKYEYRCVAGPTVIGVTTEAEKKDAVKSFEKIINEQAQEGWEYVGIDEFRTSEPPGCFGGNVPKITTFKMLVFRRKKAA